MPDARQGFQVFEVVGDFPAESTDNLGAAGANVFRLVVIEPGRADVFFKLFLRDVGVVLNGSIFF